MKNIEIKKTVRKLQITKTYSVIARTLARINPFKNSVLDCFAPLATTAVIFAFCFMPFISFSQGFSPFVGSGGNGTVNNPYLISTPADLIELSKYVNGDTITTYDYFQMISRANTHGKYFKMTNDIDMRGVDSMSTIGDEYFVDYVTREVYYHFFCGNFDGGGFTIKNFTNDCLFNALFGRMVSASISNLTLDSTYNVLVHTGEALDVKNCIVRNITTGLNFGFGSIAGGHVSNCHVINAKINGSNCCITAGFGSIQGSLVEDCSVINSSITGKYVCGFSGYCDSVLRCGVFNTTITAVGGSYYSPASAIGFTVGIGNSNRLLAECCVSNCNITGESVIGFGGFDCKINNCYAQASLHRTANPVYDPDYRYWSNEGTVGFNSGSSCGVVYDNGQYYPIYGTISNCYAACNLTTPNNGIPWTGSFGSGTEGTYINNYYLIQSPFNAFWNGGYSNGVIGKNQVDFKLASMADYPGTANNSLNLNQPTKPWKPDCRYYPINKGYPILSWQYLQSVVITLPATGITQTSATLQGIVIENSDTTVRKGFQWRKTGDFAWNTVLVNGIDTISAPITGLISDTMYEFKSFITTTDTTKYGDTLTFTTLKEPSVVITLPAADITKTSATLNGKVIENDEVVVERGFEWRKTGADNWNTVLANGTENISYSLTALTPKTEYEFKAYITTTESTKYGDTLTFSTLEEPAIVITLLAADISQTSATLNGEVVENDEVVVERGFEWRKTGADNWNTILANGTENISYPLTALTPKTEYEFAAYIKTSIVKYGEVLSFITLEDTVPPDNVINCLSNTSKISVFPNPSTGELKISLPNPSEGGAYDVYIQIYSVVGQLVYQNNNLTNQQQITKSANNQINNVIVDISHLANGMYFLKVGDKVVRFVKE